MGLIDIVGVFRAAVAGAAQVTNHIPGLHHGPFLQTGLIGIVFTEVGVIIVPLVVKTADAQPPAAVLVPSDGLHIT